MVLFRNKILVMILVQLPLAVHQGYSLLFVVPSQLVRLGRNFSDFSYVKFHHF